MTRPTVILPEKIRGSNHCRTPITPVVLLHVRDSSTSTSQSGPHGRETSDGGSPRRFCTVSTPHTTRGHTRRPHTHTPQPTRIHHTYRHTTHVHTHTPHTLTHYTRTHTTHYIHTYHTTHTPHRIPTHHPRTHTPHTDTRTYIHHTTHATETFYGWDTRVVGLSRPSPVPRRSERPVLLLRNRRPA